MAARAGKIKAKENRKTFRLSFSVPFLAIVKDQPTRSIPAEILNVSMSGARILTQIPLSTNHLIELLLELGQGSISVPARIVWEKKYRIKFLYGIEFEGKHLDAMARKIFLDFDAQARSILWLKKFLASIPERGQGKKNGSRK